MAIVIFLLNTVEISRVIFTSKREIGRVEYDINLITIGKYPVFLALGELRTHHINIQIQKSNATYDIIIFFNSHPSENISTGV